VKDVRSLYSILTTIATIDSPVHDMKAISVFPSPGGELVSINTLYRDTLKAQGPVMKVRSKKRAGILRIFHF
jgi:hypothetical protein